MSSETANGSDDEDAEDENYAARASTKKEKKRQEREAQRQVRAFHTSQISNLTCVLFITGHGCYWIRSFITLNK